MNGELIIEWVPIDSLTPYASNPRRNENAIEDVAASLRAYGWRQPIAVTEGMTIVAGHTRWLAAKKILMTQVPIHIIRNLTPAQIRAYRLADNRTAQNATWDNELLALELSGLRDDDDFDLELTGFSDKELQRLLADTLTPAGSETKDFERKFEVVATCEDEADQEAVYKLLISKGYQCKILSM